MTSQERLEEIGFGIDKIRKEKPYDNHSDAIAALDWLTAASNDVRKILGASDDTGEMARLQDQISTLDRLHSSVVASIKRTDTKVPERHLKQTANIVEI